MKKSFLKILKIIIVLYFILCGFLYFFQEKLIFFPEKLDKNYQYNFLQNFEEINIKATDGKIINGLLFKVQKSKGVIFYLHGNAGNLSSWGDVAETYTKLNYDVYMIDYRSFGKSEGEITEPEQLFKDDQSAYNEIKKRYKEDKTIILGYSIGTGLASKLASANHPKLLILQAPYYNLTDMMKQRFPFIPTFILKYKFATNDYLKNCKMSVILFHGDQDEVIYYGSSIKLKKEFKKNDFLITLHQQGHNGITENQQYKTELKNILSQ